MTNTKQDERTPVYTEGVCGDGAMILRDGQPFPISSAIDALNAYTSTEALREALEPFKSMFTDAINMMPANYADDRTVGIEGSWGKFHSVTLGDIRKFVAALSGSPAPSPDIEELIVAAYKRGFQWCVENASDPEAAAYVGKAARDYADKTMNAPSAGVTAPPETQIVTSHALPVTMWDRIATAVVKRVAELPDRTSPDDRPDAMLVTGEELHRIIMSEFDTEIG